MSSIDRVKQRFVQSSKDEMTLQEYLELAKTDKSVYASPAERMLKAIGEPRTVKTSQDDRLKSIFANKDIKVYDTFKDFYGMEETIEKIVSFFKHAAQGLEEKKQILYLLGPVGSAKSSLAEKLKKLMEKEPIYALAIRDKDNKLQISPVQESPLGLFTAEDEEELSIPGRYLTGRVSPWAIKRLNVDLKGDANGFKVVKLYPNLANQLAIAKTEPGDENNQDISALVGKVDIRKLERYAQDDTDSYSYSGGLCKANQGILEFVEMFKAPIKVLHPLLTATQEGNYNGTEAISSIPFTGIILAHSNESEWTKFKNNKDNEAFLDRTYIVRVPYCLRKTDCVKVHKKLIKESSLGDAPIAPMTLELLSEFEVLTRLIAPDNNSIYLKMRTYDGERLKDKEPSAKSLMEYKDNEKDNTKDEGMSGMSPPRLL